jgi:hypothetical protein
METGVSGEGVIVVFGLVRGGAMIGIGRRSPTHTHPFSKRLRDPETGLVHSLVAASPRQRRGLGLAGSRSGVWELARTSVQRQPRVRAGVFRVRRYGVRTEPDVHAHTIRADKLGKGLPERL